jgi:hypothetical protein
MFKKKYGFGESEYEHYPDGFKLPKMPSARELLKEIKEREKAEREKPPDCADNDKGEKPDEE